jgi:hypothetical protein
VYVNPTAQTESIGNSGMLEIHLKGVATIQACDFVPEPEAAPVVVERGDSFHFKAEISNSEASDVIDLAGNPASIDHHENAAATSAPLAISAGAQTLELSPQNHHSSDNFNVVPDPTASAAVNHVLHDLMP